MPVAVQNNTATTLDQGAKGNLSTDAFSLEALVKNPPIEITDAIQGLNNGTNKKIQTFLLSLHSDAKGFIDSGYVDQKGQKQLQDIASLSAVIDAGLQNLAKEQFDKNATNIAGRLSKPEFRTELVAATIAILDEGVNMRQLYAYINQAPLKHINEIRECGALAIRKQLGMLAEDETLNLAVRVNAIAAQGMMADKQAKPRVVSKPSTNNKELTIGEKEAIETAVDSIKSRYPRLRIDADSLNRQSIKSLGILKGDPEFSQMPAELVERFIKGSDKSLAFLNNLATLKEFGVKGCAGSFKTALETMKMRQDINGHLQELITALAMHEDGYKIVELSKRMIVPISGMEREIDIVALSKDGRKQYFVESKNSQDAFNDKNFPSKKATQLSDHILLASLEAEDTTVIIAIAKGKQVNDSHKINETLEKEYSKVRNRTLPEYDKVDQGKLTKPEVIFTNNYERNQYLR